MDRYLITDLKIQTLYSFNNLMFERRCIIADMEKTYDTDTGRKRLEKLQTKLIDIKNNINIISYVLKLIKITDKNQLKELGDVRNHIVYNFILSEKSKCCPFQFQYHFQLNSTKQINKLLTDYINEHYKRTI